MKQIMIYLEVSELFLPKFNLLILKKENLNNLSFQNISQFFTSTIFSTSHFCQKLVRHFQLGSREKKSLITISFLGFFSCEHFLVNYY